MVQQALQSYAALGGVELWNAARLSTYVENGIKPSLLSLLRCTGCEGLEEILPCIGSEAPEGGYQLPELDDAPWYDPAVPESKDFAGFMPMEVTMSSPYTRTVTQNINEGQTLGRLRRNGRTIVVRGFLIGKTCCATQYGLSWLTDALAGSPCSGDDCGGERLDFLSCCPNMDETGCLYIVNEDGEQVLYIRPDELSEYQRASDFWRTMHGVGVVSGPDILSCRGNSCGCGCGSLIEVEFTLATESAFLNSIEKVVLPTTSPDVSQCEQGECDFVWSVAGDCDPETACAPAPDCLEDPLCPLPALPPAPKPVLSLGCACTPFSQSKVCTSVVPVREWGSATLNFEVYAGDKDLRNLKIQVWQNPLGKPCNDPSFEDCDACVTLIVNYVPAGGTLRFSGEERKVTVTCNGRTRNALRNISTDTGMPFAWPDLTCVPICACVTFDCLITAPNATVTVFMVERDL